MALNGFALGGAEQGIKDAQAAGVAQQTADQAGSYQKGLLDLAQRRIQNEQTRDLFARADKQRGELMNVIADTIKALKLNGKDNATISQAIQPLVQPLKKLTASSGLDPSTIDAQIATTLAQPGFNPGGVATLAGSGTPGVTAAPANTAPSAGVTQNLTGPGTTITGVDYGPVTDANGKPIATGGNDIQQAKRTLDDLTNSLMRLPANAPPYMAEALKTRINIAAAQLNQLQTPPEVKTLTGPTGESQIAFVNPRTQSVTMPTSGPGAMSATDAAARAGKTGDEFLATLPPETAALVKRLADYKINPATLSIRGGHRERLLGLVSQYDPTYDQAFYPARAAAIKEFTAGGVSSPAGQITAGNTAIQHAGELSDAVEEMKNVPGLLARAGNAGTPFLSYASNRLKNASVLGTAEGQALTKFLLARQHFSEELTKFYAGSAGSEAERERVLSVLDQAKSLPELRAAINTEAELISGKVNALQDRWKIAMGGPKAFTGAVSDAIPDFPIIQKKSQAALDLIQKRYGISAPKSNIPAPPPGAVLVTPGAQ